MHDVCEMRVIAYTPEPLVARALNDLLIEDLHPSWCRVVLEPTPLAATAKAAQADVALVTLSPEIDWGVLITLRRESPSTKVILWVQEVSTEIAHQALHFGVRGILRRTLGPEMLVKCLRKVHEGELWFEKALTQVFLAGRKVNLSKRESELVKLLAQGLKNKEIATALGISEGTVKVYLSKLYDKVGAKDRFELALFGLRNLQCGAGPIYDELPMRSLFVDQAGLLGAGDDTGPENGERRPA
jgi:DNA-binding NarL/FixJ family response regulator